MLHQLELPNNRRKLRVHVTRVTVSGQLHHSQARIQR